MAVTIDPGVKLLPDDHNVFVLHPGENKRFYREFGELNAVFLDFPGIQFVGAPSAEDPNLWNKLRMARAIASWHRNGKPADRIPSRDPSAHSTSTSTRERPRYFHEVIDLYTDARKGDLIVVPGPGYTTPVLFGEFTTDFDPEFVVESRRYPFEKIPARAIRWLPSAAVKGEFSQRIIRLLQNRSALIRVRLEADRREIYSAAYGNYIWKESSGNLLRVTTQHVDLNDLSQAIDLTNYFAAQYLALRNGHLEEFLSLPLDDARERYYDKAFFGEIDVEIHSPGIIGRVMKTATMAAYVSTMLALSAAQISAEDAASAVVSNSQSIVTNACDLELQADIRETMVMYGNYDIWERKHCPRSKKARDSVGLETDVKVKKDD